MPDRPDAVYANFDALGSATLRAAGEHGLGVPRDLLVAVCADRESFDGVAVEPTTLNLNPGSTATEAVELLIDVIQGRAPADPRRIIPTRLVPRASTAR
jgi:LacI family transcriptional regulator